MNTRVEPLRAGLAILTTLGLVIAMMMVFTGPADAASVVPEHLQGAENTNKTCAANQGTGQSWSELKVDSQDLGNGTFTDGTLTVTITNFTANSFDWSSNIGVDAVIVKTGQAGANLYRYDPPAESMGDTNLVSPGANAISHISFCYDLPDTTTTTTTTTVADTTTSTVADTTTSTVADTTTSTVADTTTSTVADTTTSTVADTTTTTVADTTTTTAEVLGTVITTSTTAPVVQVTTTIADEVLGTQVEAEELPFTGIDNDQLVGMGVLLLASGLIMLAVTGRREES